LTIIHTKKNKESSIPLLPFYMLVAGAAGSTMPSWVLPPFHHQLATVPPPDHHQHHPTSSP